MKRFIKHTSMVAIFQNHKHNAFNFKHVSLDEVKRSKKLRCEEGFAHTDIATEVIKNNSDIFADFVFLNFSYWIASSVFSTNLKNADITHYAKKIKKNNYQYQCLVKISIWLSKRIRYTTMFVGYHRKIASEFR